MLIELTDEQAERLYVLLDRHLSGLRDAWSQAESYIQREVLREERLVLEDVAERLAQVR